ncbi:MAG: GHMP kinase, partial [Desulfurococcaceae archaeon]
MNPRVVIKTPARLHLGIINPFNPKYRLYMSLGVAIDYPNNIVVVHSNKPFMIQGCRSSEIYDKIARIIDEYDLKTGYVYIEKCIPRHVGLGSTTQLLLAVAHGLLLANNIDEDIETIARKLGLGSVSGVGTYVYKYGGFIIDSGKKSLHEFPRLIFRHDFPSKWRFIVITPRGIGLDEKQEEAVFREP